MTEGAYLISTPEILKEGTAAEIALTELHAGGKFESKAYQDIRRAPGVGVSVVNALSEIGFDVDKKQNGKVFQQHFDRRIAGRSARCCRKDKRQGN